MLTLKRFSPLPQTPSPLPKRRFSRASLGLMGEWTIFCTTRYQRGEAPIKVFEESRETFYKKFLWPPEGRLTSAGLTNLEIAEIPSLILADQ